MTKVRTIASRTARVSLSALLALALGSGLICADQNRVVAGHTQLAHLTGSSSQAVHVSEPYSLMETVVDKKVAATIPAATKKYEIDKNVVKKALENFEKTEGVGDKYGYVVADAQGTQVGGHNASSPLTPASTLKTLTALAAVHTLNMNETLPTQVFEVCDGAGKAMGRGNKPAGNNAETIKGKQADHSCEIATLVIKGNGDMLLGSGINDPQHVTGRAGLKSLAEQTAQKLKQEKISQVHLVVDDSFFVRSMPEHMPPEYLQIGYFTPTSSMAIDQGKQFGDWQKSGVPDSEALAYAPREENPVPAAVASFATSLKQRGISITSGADGKKRADGTLRQALRKSEPIAVVHSAPLWQILHLTLTLSDNTLAELFGRLVAHHLGYENSPQGARQAVYDTVKKLGVDLTGANLSDASGLSDGSALTPLTLLSVQEKLLNWAGASAWEGQPVSGEIDTTGDLRDFSDADHGVIHLKSGSLDDVTSIVASIETRRGGVILVSVIVNNPPSHYAASRAIDKLLVDLIGA